MPLRFDPGWTLLSVAEQRSRVALVFEEPTRQACAAVAPTNALDTSAGNIIMVGRRTFAPGSADRACRQRLKLKHNVPP